MTSRLLLLCIAAVLAGAPMGAWAAPCCAGSAALPSLMTGDEAATLSSSVSHAWVVGDAPAEGTPVFRGAGDRETTQAFRLSGAKLLSDFWQAGASLQALQHTRERSGRQEQNGALGDARLSVAYEAMPEWTYSAWKPKGYAFLQLTLPVGKSLYESQNGTDALGEGFFSASLGWAAVKRWSAWDASIIPEAHYSLPRSFYQTGLRVVPGWGASVLLGGGYSWGNARVGLRTQPTYQESRRLEDLTGSTAPLRTSLRWVWDSGIDGTYLFENDLSLTGSYSDQTWFGPARNVTLSRSFLFSLQKRFSR